jgi:hypothetical protein
MPAVADVAAWAGCWLWWGTEVTSTDSGLASHP